MIALYSNNLIPKLGSPPPPSYHLFGPCLTVRYQEDRTSVHTLHLNPDELRRSLKRHEVDWIPPGLASGSGSTGEADQKGKGSAARSPVVEGTSGQVQGSTSASASSALDSTSAAGSTAVSGSGSTPVTAGSSSVAKTGGAAAQISTAKELAGQVGYFAIFDG